MKFKKSLQVSVEFDPILFARLINVSSESEKTEDKLQTIRDIVATFERSLEYDANTNPFLDICATTIGETHSPLHSCNWPKMLQIFIGQHNERRWMLFMTNSGGYSYIDGAMLSYRLDMARYLVEKIGVDNLYRSQMGDSILQRSVANQDPEVFFYLLEKFPQLLLESNAIHVSSAQTFIAAKISRGDHKNLARFFASLSQQQFNDVSYIPMGDDAKTNIIHFALTKIDEIKSRKTLEEPPTQADINETFQVLIRNLPQLLKMPNGAGVTPFAQAIAMCDINFCEIILRQNPELLCRKFSTQEEIIDEKTKIKLMRNIFAQYESNPKLQKDLFGIINQALLDSFDAKLFHLSACLIKLAEQIRPNLSPKNLQKISAKIENLFYASIKKNLTNLTSEIVKIYPEFIGKDHLEELQEKLFDAIKKGKNDIAIGIVIIHPELISKTHPVEKFIIEKTNGSASKELSCSALAFSVKNKKDEITVAFLDILERYNSAHEHISKESADAQTSQEFYKKFDPKKVDEFINELDSPMQSIARGSATKINALQIQATL